MNKLLTSLLLLSSLLFCAWYFNSCGKNAFSFHGDALGYYMYLPSTFIYHNLKSVEKLPTDKLIDNRIIDYATRITSESSPTPKGYYIIKYTYGIAAMEAPFFFIAHAIEKISGGIANGYSTTYLLLLKVSSMVYALFGLLLVYHVLKSLFSKELSLLGVIILLIGTNLFWFTFYQAGMAHVPLFFLYAVVLYCTIQVHKKARRYLFVAIGLAAGLITVIRPTDVICLWLPLFYGIYSIRTFVSKSQWLWHHRAGLLIAACCYCLPLIPQLLYWKQFAGSFVYFSYGNEKFNWQQPMIMDGLFSFRNGWLSYTPVMAFALLGLLIVPKQKSLLLPVCLILPVYVYVIYCWHCYTYINGLGSRPMIDLYPILAVPLVALTDFVSKQKSIVRYTALVLIAFCSYVNVSFSMLKARGLLNSEESNITYNMHMLFKWTANYADLVTFDLKQIQPDSESLIKVKTLGYQGYEDSLSTHYVCDTTRKSRYVFRMAAQDEFHEKGIEIPYKKTVFGNARWLKCSGRFCCPLPYNYFKHLLIFEIKRGDSIKHWSGLQIDNKIGLAEGTAPASDYTNWHIATNQWGYIYYFIPIPKNTKELDQLRLYIWNVGRQEILFDDLCLELYKEK